MFVLVTGGSGSGKSAYAESRIMGFGAQERYYIATMMCFDEESLRRIARHRQMRAGKGFQTIERYTNLAGLRLEAEGPSIGERQIGPSAGHGRKSVLLECMSNLAANEMYAPKGAGKEALQALKRGIDSLRLQCHDLVVVTNEIFSDGITYDQSTMEYMKLLGDINCYMASAADEVVEVVYGIPVTIKAGTGSAPVPCGEEV